MRIREKIAPSRPAYKRIDIFTPKKTHPEYSNSPPRPAFIMLGNKNRSRSKNKSIDTFQTQEKNKALEGPLIKLQKLKTSTGYIDNPEKDKENRPRCNSKVRNSRIKTQQSGIWSKQKKELSFTVSLFPGEHKFGYECKNQRNRSRSKSKSKMKRHPKLKKRLQKVKQYDFIQQCFSDMELEAIFNELELAEIPEVRWGLIIIDRAYNAMKQLEWKLKSGQITRE